MGDSRPPLRAGVRPSLRVAARPSSAPPPPWFTRGARGSPRVARYADRAPLERRRTTHVAVGPGPCKNPIVANPLERDHATHAADLVIWGRSGCALHVERSRVTFRTCRHGQPPQDPLRRVRIPARDLGPARRRRDRDLPPSRVRRRPPRCRSPEGRVTRAPRAKRASYSSGGRKARAWVAARLRAPGSAQAPGTGAASSEAGPASPGPVSCDGGGTAGGSLSGS